MVSLYLLWRHSGVEPVVAWGRWPPWQFDLLAAGLKEELEVLRNARSGGEEGDPLVRAESRAPDFGDVDSVLEGLVG